MSSAKTRPPRAHRHKAITAHALQQRAGIPYEVERTICVDCRRLLDERPLRRTSA